MQTSDILSIIQSNLDHATFCSDSDWEFNSGANDINPGVARGLARATLQDLAKEINKAAGEELIHFKYKMKRK